MSLIDTEEGERRSIVGYLESVRRNTQKDKLGVPDQLVTSCREAGSILKREGFVFWKDLSPQQSTLDIARHIGLPIEMAKLLPFGGIPTIQSLLPKTTDQAPKNRYSGHYGLGAFPLHTDLAHWAVPPRYFLLRCLVGAEGVETKLLPASYVTDRLGRASLQKAVLRIRRHLRGSSGLLRILVRFHQEDLFRWDSVFLEPVNNHAMATKHMMDRQMFDGIIRVCLRNAGDTLLVDNWRFLHGRSAVPLSSDRQIERVYLSEVNRNDC